MTKLDWPPIIGRAAVIVRGYRSRVTLRQLHYRLVSEGAYANTQTNYKRLSSLTAQARRDGRFPALFDRGREIHRALSWTGPREALDSVVNWYRLDRTAGQDVTVVLGVEKNGLVELLSSWFDTYGVPVVALGGYASQSYVDEIRGEVRRRGRRAVLLYAGDFDPSGEDIERDFKARTRCFDVVERVALTAEQVDAYGLPPLPGKTTDSRAAGFAERHGELVQVEVDALAPSDLRALYADALAHWWDEDKYQAVLAREDEDKSRLRTVAEEVLP